MVIMAEISRDGRREVATTPPIEWPITTIGVLGGYSERI